MKNTERLEQSPKNYKILSTRKALTQTLSLPAPNSLAKYVTEFETTSVND